jgi:hypothetical protein
LEAAGVTFIAMRAALVAAVRLRKKMADDGDLA